MVHQFYPLFIPTANIAQTPGLHQYWLVPLMSEVHHNPFQQLFYIFKSKFIPLLFLSALSLEVYSSESELY
jgi:hypothetical protein